MTFGEHVRQVAAARGLALGGPHDPEPLARLDYAEERAVKQAALAAFWKEHALAGAPDVILAAPQPRAYRTTTKRRASVERHGMMLSFPGAAPPARGTAAPSLLDRPDHVALYDSLVAALGRPSARGLAEALQYAIVRGESLALALVLNVRVFDAQVVRGAKQLVDTLRSEPRGLGSAALYLDPTGSDYYLEAKRPSGVLSYKRLFGPDWLEVKVDGVKLRFPPVVFSQVNAAMLPAMVDTARALLSPLAGRHLVDLYCGYGLFALTLGREAARTTGVDHDGPAIEAARGNAAHVRADARFVAARIGGEPLATRLPPAGRTPEVVLLDPPRQGTEPGVVEAIAARRPERVLHVCCGTDEIPREMAAWAAHGYALKRAAPLDLFAGTTGLETLLLLSPLG